MNLANRICDLTRCPNDVYAVKPSTLDRGPVPTQPVWRENVFILSYAVAPLLVQQASYRLLPSTSALFLLLPAVLLIRTSLQLSNGLSSSLFRSTSRASYTSLSRLSRGRTVRDYRLLAESLLTALTIVAFADYAVRFGTFDEKRKGRDPIPANSTGELAAGVLGTSLSLTLRHRLVTRGTRLITLPLAGYMFLRPLFSMLIYYRKEEPPLFAFGLSFPVRLAAWLIVLDYSFVRSSFAFLVRRKLTLLLRRSTPTTARYTRFLSSGAYTRSTTTPGTPQPSSHCTSRFAFPFTAFPVPTHLLLHCYSYSSDTQELLEILLLPLLASLVVPMHSFSEQWLVLCYTMYVEMLGHSGIRARWKHPVLGWLLEGVAMGLTVEDHVRFRRVSLLQFLPLPFTSALPSPPSDFVAALSRKCASADERAHLPLHRPDPPRPLSFLQQDIHHRFGKAGQNYGKQTRIWDRLFGTCAERIETRGM